MPAIQPVNEISLRLLPPHDPYDHQHSHHHAAPATTKAPIPEYTTRMMTTTKRPVTGGANNVEILKYEFVHSANGYKFL